MKKLKEKIIKKIYIFETINTSVRIAVKSLTVLIFTALGIFLSISIYRQLVEQQTLDLLEIFSEDADIVRQYLRDVLWIVYQELPLLSIIIVLIVITGFSLIIVSIIKNFGRTGKKIKALINYWAVH